MIALVILIVLSLGKQPPCPLPSQPLWGYTGSLELAPPQGASVGVHSPFSGSPPNMIAQS